MSETPLQTHEIAKISLENFKNFEEPLLKNYTETKLKEMTEKIKKHGVSIPILAHPIPGEANAYKVIEGHDIFIAAKEAGLKAILAIIPKQPHEDEIKILDEKLQKAKKAVHNLNSYTDEIYKLSEIIEYKNDTEDKLNDQLKSKYEKLRHLTKNILGKEGMKNLDFLKSREILTMFLSNLVNYDNLYKELIEDVKTKIEDKSSRNTSIRDFIAKFFLENAVSTEKKFGDSKVEIPQKYAQEYNMLSGVNLKEDFIQSKAKKLETELFKIFKSKVNIDPHCKTKTEDWFKETLKIDLRKIYCDTTDVFRLFKKSYRPGLSGRKYTFENFLDDSIKDNYTYMTKIGIIAAFFNADRELVKKPIIELTIGIEDKTFDWFQNKFGLDLRSIYPEGKSINDLFEDAEEFEAFLESKVKDNYENAKIHNEITNMIDSKLGICNVRIDPLCEDNTNEWIKKNLHVDLKKSSVILNFFETELEFEDFLNKSVRDNLEDMFNKEYGSNLNSRFNIIFDDTMNLIKTHFDSIKNIDNINFKIAMILIYNEIYTSIMPLINNFQDNLLYKITLQNYKIAFSYKENYEKIKDLLFKIKYTYLKTEEIIEQFDFNKLSNKQLELIEAIIKNQDKLKTISDEQFFSILMQLDWAIVKNNFPETLESILNDI